MLVSRHTITVSISLKFRFWLFILDQRAVLLLVEDDERVKKENIEGPKLDSLKRDIKF